MSTITLAMDPTATSPTTVGDFTSLFTYTDQCLTPPTCSGGNSPFAVSSVGVISAPVTALVEEQSFQIECIFADVSSTVEVSIEVACGPNSVTFSPSTFPTTQTFDLLPNTQPTFTFAPYTSSDNDCPLEQIIVSDSAAYDQSPSFDSPIATTATEVKVSASLQHTATTRNFYIQFMAAGGHVDKIPCVLVTRCAATSVPLSSSDFPSQNAYVGGGSVYYEILQPTADVTGCQPTSWTIGDDSDSSAQPSDLQALTIVSSNYLRVTPTDASLISTYSFYLWAHLPGGAESVVGPVVLQVGCSSYIDPTLRQTSSQPQQSLTFSGGDSQYTLTLQVDETNLISDGTYLLEFDTFSSTQVGCSASAITTYALSGSSSSLVGLSADTASFASLSYSPGDTTFKIQLTTSMVGTFSFYVYSKDSEDRWDNERISNLVEITVTCGIEHISLSQPKVSLSLTKGLLASINFNHDLSGKFVSSKPACPIIKYDFYKALPSSPWDLALISISLNSGHVDPTLEYTGTITTSTPARQSIFVKGTSFSGSSSILEVEIVVCGNEIVSVADAAPYQIILNSTGVSGDVHTIPEPTLIDFFSITNLALSSEACLVESFAIKADAACSLPLGTSPFSFNDSFNILEIITTSPSAPSVAYVCLTSKGRVTISKAIIAEICGLETPVAESTALRRRFLKNSGTGGVQTIRLAEYNTSLHSSNPNCPLASYTLVDEARSPSTPYTGTLASITPTFDVQVSTSTPGEHKFFIEGQALSGSSEFLEVTVEIYEEASENFLNTINTAPFFNSPPEHMNIQHEPGEPLEVTIRLPAIQDSHSNLCGLLVTSPLGSYLASNNSILTEWDGVKSSTSPNFVYSFSQNTLTIRVDAGEARESLQLTLTLIDEAKATTVSTLSLTFSDVQAEETIEKVKPVQQEDDSGEDVHSEDFSSPKDEGVIKAIQPTAKATQLTHFGELTLEFSHRMKPRDISDLTETILNLYVKPYQPENRDLSFTWRATRFYEKTLVLELDWAQPSDVSQNVELDTLAIEVLVEDFFIATERLRGLGADSRNMKIKVPRQLKPTSFSKGVESTFSAASGTLVGATWAALAINTVLSGFLNMMLGLINSLQLIVHLPAFRIAFPPNAFMVFQSLIPLVTFDLLETFEDQVSVVMDLFVSPTQDDSEVPQQFQNVGFDDFRPLPNLGTLGLFVLIYFGKLVVFSISFVVGMISKKNYRVTSYLQKRLFYSEILFIFIEGYLDFSLAAFLFLSWDAIGGGLNWGAFTLIISFTFGVIPLSLVWIASLPSGHFNDESFQQRWGPLFEDIRTRFVGQRLFFLAFILRRAVFTGVAFMFAPTPSLQLIALNLTNLSMLIYQGYHRPISSRLRNFIEITNEVLICLSSFHLMAFTDVEPSSSTQLIYAWSLAGTVGLHILFNIGIIAKVFAGSFFIRAQALSKRAIAKFSPEKAQAQNDYLGGDSQEPTSSEGTSMESQESQMEEEKSPDRQSSHSTLDRIQSKNSSPKLSVRSSRRSGASWGKECLAAAPIQAQLPSLVPSVEAPLQSPCLSSEVDLKPKPKAFKKKILRSKPMPIHPQTSSPPPPLSSLIPSEPLSHSKFQAPVHKKAQSKKKASPKPRRPPLKKTNKKTGVKPLAIPTKDSSSSVFHLSFGA